MKNADIHLSGCLKKFFALTTLLIVAACSNMQQTQTVSEWLPENTPPTFTTAGKLAVKNGNQGFQADFAWENKPFLKSINIYIPLVGTVGWLCQDSFGATAQNQKRQTFEASTVSELAYNLTGQEIPLDYLDLWTIGSYNPDEMYKILPNGNLLQNDWTIQRSIDEQGNPRRLILQRQNLKITIIFKEFKNINRNPLTQCLR